MLLKNGSPSTDVYEWKCDECEAKSKTGNMPEVSMFEGGIVRALHAAVRRHARSLSDVRLQVHHRTHEELSGIQ